MVATTASSTIVKPASSRRRPRHPERFIGRRRPPWRTSPSRRASRPARMPAWRGPGAMPASVISATARVPERSARVGEVENDVRCPRCGPSVGPLSAPEHRAAPTTAAATDGIEAHAQRAAREASRRGRAEEDRLLLPDGEGQVRGIEVEKDGRPVVDGHEPALDADAADTPSEGARESCSAGPAPSATGSARCGGGARAEDVASEQLPGARLTPGGGVGACEDGGGVRWRGGWTPAGLSLEGALVALRVLDARAALVGDVGVGPDVDGHQVLFGDVGDADDVRRQRQHEVRRLRVRLDLREEPPEHRDVSEERDRLPSRSICRFGRDRRGSWFPRPCRRMFDEIVRVPMIGCGSEPLCPLPGRTR